MSQSHHGLLELAMIDGDGQIGVFGLETDDIGRGTVAQLDQAAVYHCATVVLDRAMVCQMRTPLSGFA